MSDSSNFGFAKLVPGFDFLQNLAKGTSQGLPQMPTLSSWIAPTLNVEELEKRIAELKAVHFWLDQNGKALSATIQALEVQKMTLATLQGMNFSMGELASALQAKPATESVTSSMQRVGEAAAAAGQAVQAASAARRKAAAPGKAEPPAQPATEAGTGEAAPAKAADAGSGKKGPSAGSGSTGSAVDPLQWWGSLTQQFQQIAAGALQDVAQKAAAAGAREGAAKPASRGTQAAARTTGSVAAAPAPAKAAARKPPGKAAARKAPARKAAAKP